MAKFRMVHAEFWDDPKVVEEMTPEDKFFFLYLLTNQNTKQCGIYQITKKQVAFEMGYSIESINSLFDRFERHHKLIKYNPKTREIAIKNWGKYNLNRAGTPMINCVKLELENIDDRSLINFVIDSVKNKSFKDLFSVYAPSAVTEPLRTPLRGEEEEKEEEKEEEEYKDITPTGSNIKTEYSPFVFLTDKEFATLKELLKDELEDYFIRYGSWISGQTARVQKSRNAYLSIRNWHREDQKKKAAQPTHKGNYQRQPLKPQIPIVTAAPTQQTSEEEMEELRALARKLDGKG